MVVCVQVDFSIIPRNKVIILFTRTSQTPMMIWYHCPCLQTRKTNNMWNTLGTCFLTRARALSWNSKTIVMEFEDLYKTCRKRYAKVEYTTFHQKLAQGMTAFLTKFPPLKKKSMYDSLVRDGEEEAREKPIDDGEELQVTTRNDGTCCAVSGTSIRGQAVHFF